MQMDDFDVILGTEFLVENDVILISCTKSLLIIGEKPAIVPAKVKQST